MPSPMHAELCRFLEWDSRFFGLNVGRVNPPRLERHEMSKILDWCRVQQIDCLYLLADSNHDDTTRLANEYGFDFVDIRITFELSSVAADNPAPSQSSAAIRPFQSTDLPTLRIMAGRLHQDTRFFSDPNFPRARSEELYRVWIERSCTNPRGKVFVAEAQGKPAAYIACSAAEAESGQIELIAVEDALQGQGVGRALVKTALNWFAA